ncbi:hypothetical protein QF032_000132 [Streptomyces achromogenes]|uniref:hypothetical protein n=1 Tax=Streptomyces achromogenes TaxID=67255 RepID=UPI002785E7DA|nr:hypothetical protein [Streptomyces achromogenes]MDQ0828288.1 hypothetical protein [Streptomyces achromogenes]
MQIHTTHTAGGTRYEWICNSGGSGSEKDVFCTFVLSVRRIWVCEGRDMGASARSWSAVPTSSAEAGIRIRCGSEYASEAFQQLCRRRGVAQLSAAGGKPPIEFERITSKREPVPTRNVLPYNQRLY